jgi:hypothetical protein
MAETLISPGVLARENDTSFISQQPVTVGAAIIGPTVKGPIELPTVVTSYSEFVNTFGDVLTSGSDTYSYFTSIAAYNYFSNNGNTLLVSRVVSGSYSPATSTDILNSVTAVAGIKATSSFNATSVTVTTTGSGVAVAFEIGDNVYYLAGWTSNYTSDELDYQYFNVNVGGGWNLDQWGNSLATAINTSTMGIQNYITASYNTSTDTFSFTASNSGTEYNSIKMYTQGYVGFATSSMTLAASFGGATDPTSATAFVLETISEGVIMNSSSSLDSQGALANGSTDNVRWQIVNASTSSGTFNLLIRQGNDNTNSPIVLETWTNLSLDPKAPNFISNVIGDYIYSYNPANNQIEVTGNYPNASKYVRVKQVNYLTPDYFDNTGIAKPQYTASIPVNANGSFTGATGDVKAGANFYDTINNTNTQGLVAANYDNMIDLLSNKDDYQFNALYTPGLVKDFATHTSKINNIITNTQDRGDNIYVTDLVGYGSSVSTVTGQAASVDSSYVATYWPWCQILDPGTGKRVWVPASAMIAGVYAYNDRVSEPWFAPAGINRGGLGRVIRVEQKLPQSSRDTLYQGKVNPIATFPGTGVVVYGQKTLQTRASALDRVNVRRLLIALKSYISQVANTLVFEQNTIATRNQFLSQVNPYLESVQQRQGLYAFKVVMDDTNNTPDVIDRNQLVGAIYLQPTKTAEFIYLDFNVTPTGATFPV